MVLPYQNFYWAPIELETRFGSHRYGVVVYPHMATVVDFHTGQWLDSYTGDEREELAVADAVRHMVSWDKHVHCCW